MGRPAKGCDHNPLALTQSQVMGLLMLGVPLALPGPWYISFKSIFNVQHVSGGEYWLTTEWLNCAAKCAALWPGRAAVWDASQSQCPRIFVKAPCMPKNLRKFLNCRKHLISQDITVLDMFAGKRSISRGFSQGLMTSMMVSENISNPVTMLMGTLPRPGHVGGSRTLGAQIWELLINFFTTGFSSPSQPPISLPGNISRRRPAQSTIF